MCKLLAYFVQWATLDLVGDFAAKAGSSALGHDGICAGLSLGVIDGLLVRKRDSMCYSAPALGGILISHQPDTSIADKEGGRIALACIPSNESDSSCSIVYLSRSTAYQRASILRFQGLVRGL